MTHVRIAFVVGGMEPGHDGVGDYTRCLAFESTRQGATCRVVALTDRNVQNPVRVNGSGVEMLRLPATMAWTERLRYATEFLHDIPPAWVSVQFVPYSFHRWGLAYAMAQALPRLVGEAKLHVMFHEIWIQGTDAWRRRLMSAAQRRIVLRVGTARTAIVHTSNDTYRQLLRRNGIDAETLPLFGSIPIATPESAWLDPMLVSAGCDALSGHRNEWWLAAFFGTLHSIWPPEPLMTELQGAASSAGKRLALISIGRVGTGEWLWHRMSATYTPRVPMLQLGAQSRERISQLLQTVDFGVATTPFALLGKSATVAAMLDHGLPVIVNREDCGWQRPTVSDDREAALVIRMNPEFANRLRSARRLPPVWSLAAITTRWLDALRIADAPSA